MPLYAIFRNKLGWVGVLALAMTLLAAVSLIGCGTADSPPNADSEEPVAQVDAPPAAPATVQATLAFVGDIMVHADELASAYDKASQSYDFTGFFSEVAPFLQEADLTVGNLETTLAGPEKGFSGYPRFNSPVELAAALKTAGFDVLTTANNHTLDSGEQGVLQTLANLDLAGIAHTGSFAAAEDRARPLLVSAGGIRTAILAYTYGTNGLPIPAGEDYLVSLLNPEKIGIDVAAARQAGAELVVVCPHFGVEYRRIPGDVEKQTVEAIFAAGADVVAGSHSHVLQPMARRDGAGSGLFAAYSLGNFVSGQRGRYKDSGVILFLTVEKDPVAGRVSLVKAEYLPTWVHKFRVGGKNRFRVVAVQKAIRDYEQGLDASISPADFKRLQEVWQETTTLLSGPEAPEIRNI